MALGVCRARAIWRGGGSHTRSCFNMHWMLTHPFWRGQSFLAVCAWPIGGGYLSLPLELAHLLPLIRRYQLFFTRRERDSYSFFNGLCFPFNVSGKLSNDWIFVCSQTWEWSLSVHGITTVTQCLCESTKPISTQYWSLAYLPVEYQAHFEYWQMVQRKP